MGEITILSLQMNRQGRIEWVFFEEVVSGEAYTV